MWTLLALLILAVLYKEALAHTRDVPPEFLNVQSIVETTRLEGQSAIHKSTKLDYSLGLRVGLAIRYDHYKLRNGNLYDVWEIAMAHAQNGPGDIHLHGQRTTFGHINAAAQTLASQLKADEVVIRVSDFLANPAVMAVVVACFLSQTTVHIHATGATETGAVLLTIEDGVVRVGDVNCSQVLADAVPSTEYINEYMPEKDKGIALKVTMQANHRVSAATSFTQGNLIAAVASCVKHLPSKHAMGPADRLAVVFATANSEAVTNGIVKVLAAFVAGAEIHVCAPDSDFMRCSPTIVSAPVDVVKRMDAPVLGLENVLYWHRRFSLKCLRFSSLSTRKPYQDLRLVYAHRPLSSGQYTDWNPFRASLVAHIVEECGHFNVAGPLLNTDAYDFRSFAAGVGAQIRAFGGIVQADEMKLLGLQPDGTGALVARGYNIGKATTTMEGVGETAVVPDADGFHRFPFTARWGSDNCLYILAR